MVIVKVRLRNKVGQPVIRYHLSHLSDSCLDLQKVELLVFNKYGVYDYEQPNEHGFNIREIAVIEDLDAMPELENRDGTITISGL